MRLLQSISAVSFRTFASAIVLALVLGSFAAPPRVMAVMASSGGVSNPQPNAETPAASQSAYAAPSKPVEAKKSEEDEANVFRHSKVVTAIAGFLHVDVETAAEIFEFTNFGILALAIGIPLLRTLPKTFRKRNESLSADLASARTATLEAQERLKSVEAKFLHLDAEIAAIRHQVETEIVGDEQRIKAAIEDEKARIVAQAEQEIELASQAAQRGLKQYAADLAIESAMNRLHLSPDADRALISDFARDVSAGGKN